ncbi:MAG TPA: ABC transporter permease subunit [Acidimicrobiales bacterium]|nr:ABC transporter permease subunit [Acidimicrobiales bacterium]
MGANVFTKSLWDQRRGLLGWGIGVAATILAMAAIWPSFSDADINAVLENYPSELLEAFNVQGMNTGAGFLNAELFSVVLPVMFIVYAVGRGSRLVAGEEEAGTLEMILTMPIPRSRVLVHKAGGLVVGVGVLGLVLAVTLAIVSPIFGMDVTLRAAGFAALTQWFIGCEFGLLAVAVAAATGRRSLAVGVPAAIAAASYVAFLAAQLVDALQWLRWISPFHAATTGGPLGPALPWLVWTMPAVGVVAVAAAAPVFSRRDIPG